MGWKTGIPTIDQLSSAGSNSKAGGFDVNLNKDKAFGPLFDSNKLKFPGGDSKDAGALGIGQFKADQYQVDPTSFTDNAWSENLKNDFRSQLAANQSLQAPMVHANNTDAALANAARLGPAAQAQAAQIDMSQQDQFRNAQMGLAQQLAMQAQGQGPSLAQSQLRQGTERNIANQMAMAGTAGQGNVALAQRGAAMNAASINQQAAQQAADLRAQEQFSAQGQLANVAGQARGADIGLATNQAGLTQQTNLANQSALNSFAQQQAAMQQQVEMSNQAAKNQAALANQSALMGQQNQQNQMAQFYNSGIAQQNLQQQQARMSLEQLQSGNYNAMQGINEKAYAAASGARGNLLSGLGSGLMGGAVAGGLFGGGAEGLMSDPEVVDGLAQSGSFGLRGYATGTPEVGADSGNFFSAFNNRSQAMGDEYLKDDASQNPSQGSGGLGSLAGGLTAAFMKDGGVVGGKAKVSGDSPANDTVPAMLSPGEAVVPRTAMNDPAKLDNFVDALKEYKGFKTGDGIPDEYLGHSLMHLHDRMSDLEKAFQSKGKKERVMAKAPYDVKTAQQLLSRNLISPKQFASIQGYAEGTPEVIPNDPEAALYPQTFSPPPPYAPELPAGEPIPDTSAPSEVAPNPNDSFPNNVYKGLGQAASAIKSTISDTGQAGSSTLSDVFNAAKAHAKKNHDEIIGAVYEGYTGKPYVPPAPPAEGMKPANISDASQAPGAKNVDLIQMETPQQAKARAEAELAAAKPSALDQYHNEMTKGFQDQAAAIQKAAGAGGGAGSRQAMAIEEARAADLKQQEMVEAKQKIRQVELNQIRADYDDHLNKVASLKVDPDRFWANKSTADKITAGIGLFLGAFGSHGNQAVPVITAAIDRDIQAQKANIQTQKDTLTAKGNLWNDMRNQFKDEYSADLATKSAMLQNSMLQVQAQAARYSGSGDAAAKAQIAIAQLRMEKAKVDLQFMQQKDKMDTLKKFGYDPMDKEQVERYVPNYGLITAGSPKEAEEFRTIVAKKDALFKNIDRLNEISKTPGSSITPSLRAEAQSISAILSGQLVSPLLGIPNATESEMDLVKEAKGDPNSIFSFGPAERKKLESIKTSIDNSVTSRGHVLGLRNAQEKFEGGLGITKRGP